MKQALILSIFIHITIVGVVVFLVTLPKTKQKPESVHITVVALAPIKKQEEKRQEQKSKPTPKRVIESIPTPASKPIEALPTPISLPKPIEAATPTTILPPRAVEVATPTPLPKKTPQAPQYSAAETKEAKNEYLAYIRQAIDERKIYPRNAKKLGQSGTVEVTFTVLSDGIITAISLSGSSGFTLLDNAALQILTQLAKVKPIPKELAKSSWEITIPIEYAIH